MVTLTVWHGQKPRPFRDFDQPFYLGIADDIRHVGRFTDGYFFAQPGPDGLRPSSMRFSPLYPGLLAAVAQLDGQLATNMDCLANSLGRDESCGRAAPVMRSLQWAELVTILWLIWWMAGRITGSAWQAWVALALALCTTGLLMHSVNYLMTEMTTLFFSTTATAAALRAAAPGARPRWAALAGALLALAALTRPGFLYLVYAAIPVAFLVGARTRRGLAAPLAFTAAAAATLAPWILRNALVLGRAALSFGYASHTLVQRIAFDAMSWREYALAYVCWLPNGTSLGRRYNPPQGCARFGWDAPDSFYLIGQRHLLDETLQAAGGYEHHMSYLLHQYIFQMPLWHIAVSLPLALRGAYVEKWWGFTLLFVAIWASLRALRGVNRNFLIVALPAWFMLALNATVAVNQVRYNLMLIPPYAIAGAMALDLIWRRARRG